MDMRKVLAIDIMGAAAQLDRINALVTEQKRSNSFDPNAEVPPSSRRIIAKRYTDLAEAAEAMAAPITAKAARRAVTKLRGRKNPIPIGEIAAISNSLAEVLNDEVNEVELYCLSRGSGRFYSPGAPLFGTEVDARIDDASDDISEAGKCFAVGRYTASVFHLMRAMEAAVKMLCVEVGISNVDREWGKLLSDIAKAIEPMPKGAKRDEWSAVHANLYHVKQAWRNNTMHPKRTYTEEEAREVFEAVKAFMRHLATLLCPSAEELLG